MSASPKTHSIDTQKFAIRLNCVASFELVITETANKTGVCVFNRSQSVANA
ncbi:MAG: hypothetical protein ACI9XK_004392 [Granulosicoccus sp.]|jgi:hypothetical protein